MQNRFFEDSIGGNIIPSILSADTHYFHSSDQLFIYT